MCPFKVGKIVHYILRRWLRNAGKISVVSLRFSCSSTSEPSVRDDYIADSRYVVDSVQGF